MDDLNKAEAQLRVDRINSLRTEMNEPEHLQVLQLGDAQQQMRRYQVCVAYAKRLEPWLVDAQSLGADQ